MIPRLEKVTKLSNQQSEKNDPESLPKEGKHGIFPCEEVRVKNWQKFVDELADEEVEDLAARLALRRKSARKKAAPISIEEQAIWTALCDVLHTHFPIENFLVKYGPDRWKARADLLERYINRFLPEEPSLARRQLFYTEIFQSLRRLLLAREIWISHSSLLDSVELIDHALNRDFPGYAQSGILGKILTTA
jgi:hypothetical protein